jgi:DNA integrity scanning protein DisA with diadenylate cyclase activity
MDVRLEETIKEFSTIDGAFVISGEGIIETAGTRLLATAIPPDFPKGLGTRHAAAAAITSITKALAISISQSTGSLSIFRAGHRIAEIPKPSPERLFS